MGRFYKTAKPQFVEDIIYQPPWEMMAKSAQMKQMQYDNALAKTSAINDTLNIQHIDEDTENELVSREKQLWEDQIEEVTNEIKTTGDYRKLMPRIREIQKGIAQSRQDGNIAQFEQSALTKEKLVKELQDETTKKGGDILGAQARLKTFMDDWRGNENRSLDKTLQYEALIARPEALNYDEMVSTIKDLDPEMLEYVKKTPSGGYFISKEGKEKGLTAERIMGMVSGKLMQDPNLTGYYEQRDRFGLSKGVYNRETGGLNIIESQEDILDENGNVTDTKQKLYDNELTSFMQSMLPMAYKETTEKLEYSNDSRQNLFLSQQHDINMLGFKRKEDEDKYMRDMQLRVIKGDGSDREIEIVNSYYNAGKFISTTNPKLDNILNLKKENGKFTAGSKAKLNSLFNDVEGIDEVLKDEIFTGLENGTISSDRDLKALFFNKKHKSFKTFLDGRPEIKKLTPEYYNTIMGIFNGPEDPKYADNPLLNKIKTYKNDYDKLSKGEESISHLGGKMEEYYGNKANKVLTKITDTYNKNYSDKVFSMQLFQTDNDLVTPERTLENHIENVGSFDVYSQDENGKLVMQHTGQREILTDLQDDVKEVGYTSIAANSLGDSFNTVIKTKSKGNYVLVPKRGNSPFLQAREHNIMSSEGGFSGSRGNSLSILKDEIKEKQVVQKLREIMDAAPDGTVQTKVPVPVGKVEIVYVPSKSSKTTETFNVYDKGGNLLDTLTQEQTKEFIKKNQ